MEFENLDEYLDLDNIDKNMLKRRNHGLLLTDDQVATLARYNIDVNSCTSESELLFKIDSIIEDCDEDEYAELENIAERVQEINYYKNTKK